MAQTQERTDVLAGMDWAATNVELLATLQAYIRIDTRNPPGNEDDAVAFLQPLLEREGLAVRVAATAPRRSNLVAKWAADGTPVGKPIILLNHMDVVPVERDKWSVDPFGGVVKEGMIWGRGALDMKGLGIMQLFGLLALKRAGLTPRRDVYFVAVADEEAGADFGAEQVLSQFPDLRGAGCVYNEGSVGIDFGGGAVFGIQNAEKGVFQATLVAHGTPGHGSFVNPDNAVVTLVRAATRLSRAALPLNPQPEGLAFLDAIAQTLPGVSGQLLRRRTLPGMLQFLANTDPTVASMLRDHVSLTMLDAGYKVNVIPGTARATIDMRLMPGVTEADARDWLRRTMREKKIGIETQQYVAGTRSPNSDPAFAAARAALLAEYPQARVAATMSAGATDSRIFREAGIPSFGLGPTILTRAMLAGLHGHDERVPVETLGTGARVYARTLLNLGAAEAQA